MKTSSFVHCLCAAATAVLTVACSTGSQVDTQGLDVTAVGYSARVRNTLVVVACDANDRAIRQTCEDQLVRQITQRGARPVRVPASAAFSAFSASRTADEQLTANARALHADTALLVTLKSAAGDAGPGYVASGRIADVVTGRMLWSATVVAPPSADLTVQIQGLAGVLMPSAQTAGLF